MFGKTLCVALAALLMALATSSRAQAYGCVRAGAYSTPYSSGYRASYTHYGPVTGLQHGTVGGVSTPYGGYHYDTRTSAYGGAAVSAGYVRRW